MTDLTVEELLQELLKEARESRRWMKFLAWEDAKGAIEDTLDKPWQYHLYEQLDGTTSIRDLADGLPRGKDAASYHLNRWQRIGIVSQNTDGKYDKLISLETMGIELPEIGEEDA